MHVPVHESVGHPGLAAVAHVRQGDVRRRREAPPVPSHPFGGPEDASAGVFHAAAEAGPGVVVPLR